MKYAPIIPTEGLRVLERVGIGYHFTLGQHLIRDQEYRRYYTALGRLGHFIIVDNGAAERDTPEFSTVVKAAKMVKAAEIVMPDVLGDCDATIAALTPEVLDMVPSKNRMIVPQGRTLDECFRCLNSQLAIVAARAEWITSLGIPKHYEARWPGGRVTFLERLKRESPHLVARTHIHLLGVWLDPFREISAAASTCDIRGIDTGYAAAASQRSKTLDPDAELGEHIGLAWGEPFDLDLGKKNVWTIARYAAEY